MEDSMIFFSILGAVISIAAIISFFILCRNVSRLLEVQKATYEILKKIQNKLSDKQQAEKDDFEFLNK